MQCTHNPYGHSMEIICKRQSQRDWLCKVLKHLDRRGVLGLSGLLSTKERKNQQNAAASLRKKTTLTTLFCRKISHHLYSGKAQLVLCESLKPIQNLGFGRSSSALFFPAPSCSFLNLSGGSSMIQLSSVVAFLHKGNFQTSSQGSSLVLISLDTL